MTAAEDLCSTPAERACLAELRARSRAVEGPVERHSARVFVILARLAERRQAAIDREVALCAALLHDVGLYHPTRGGRFYLASGRAAAAEILAPHSWAAARVELCLDAIELHHRLTPQWARGAEVELLRVADLIDGSAGMVRGRLDRAWLRALFERIPRDGLYPELLRHSLRGAPCVTRALAGTVLLPLQRRNGPAVS